MPTANRHSIYAVDFSQATRHLACITLWIPVRDADHLTLVFPVWTPGSYMVREYTKNIEAIEFSGQTTSGERIPAVLDVVRQGKNRWRLNPVQACDWIRVDYRLYCRENSVRTNWIERDYGFLTGAAAFPYVLGRERESLELQLHLPANWPNQATSLLPVEPQPIPAADSELAVRDVGSRLVAFHAEHFDELVDAPVVCGVFPIRKFEVGDRPHYLANVAGDALWDLDRAVDDMSKIVAEQQTFWGEVPYSHYWFINLCTEAGGGLEHDNSTVLMCSRWTMRRRESYLNWLALVSHEFFHTWNVRRLRPKQLMRYDYEQEQFLEELWIAEGITSYFDDLILVRTGLCSRDEYLSRLTGNVQAVQTSPGRRVQDLASSSWDTWVKHYRPDENSHNARISYYLKGAVLAWLLDARLQSHSQGRHNLRDVMQGLWQRCLQTGYTLDDFHELIEEMSDRDTRLWLIEQVRGVHEIDLQPALDWFGLRFTELENPPVEKSVAKVWIGSESTGTDGRLFVRRVFRNSPSDRAGLNVDDELISFDGYRVTPDIWPSRLEVYEPEQELELLVSRRGKILALKIVLGHKPKHNWQLEVDPAADAAVIENQRRWLQLHPA
jgi:predicted metalloprotease with PDZ domain